MKFAQWFQSPRRMLVKHLGKSPVIDPTAFVAPNAAVCGDVSIGPGARIMFGAQVIAEGGSIKIGRECIVMENAVLRSTAVHCLSIASHCLVGPNAHVVGSTIDEEVFLATGCAVFHGSHIGAGAEVRINGACSPWPRSLGARLCGRARHVDRFVDQGHRSHRWKGLIPS
jgi:carbonic anhydrase/acetyltransferase-like protein (isoleucine patch superfamily)